MPDPARPVAERLLMRLMGSSGLGGDGPEPGALVPGGERRGFRASMCPPSRTSPRERALLHTYERRHGRLPRFNQRGQDPFG